MPRLFGTIDKLGTLYGSIIDVCDFGPPVYAGAGPTQASFVGAYVQALAIERFQASRGGFFNVTAGAAEFMQWAAPASYGTPLFYVVDSQLVGGWGLIGTGNLTIDGDTVAYNLWQSTLPNLGTEGFRVR